VAGRTRPVGKALGNGNGRESARARKRMGMMKKSPFFQTTRTLTAKCGVCSQLRASHISFSTPPSSHRARGTPATRAKSPKERGKSQPAGSEEESLQNFHRDPGVQRPAECLQKHRKGLASHSASHASFHLPFPPLSSRALDGLPAIGLAWLIMRERPTSRNPGLFQGSPWRQITARAGREGVRSEKHMNTR
jgi:hypothetical protein